MIVGLLVLAAALVMWPGRRRTFARPAVAPGRQLSGLDAVIPQLLGVAVLALLVAWDHSPLGLLIAACGGVGAALILRRARSKGALRDEVDPALPLALTVASLLLRAGAPPSTALAGATRTVGSTTAAECENVHRRIAMGEHASSAWAGLLGDPRLAPVGRAAMRASDSGAALARAWESTAQQAKADRRLAAEIAARRVGIRALAPLGLCFLPSFVCLGVIPIVIGLAGDIL